MKRMKILATAVVFSALALQAIPGFAQVKIRAIVNNEPITSNEVAQRARFLHLVAREAPNQLLETNALEELIDEKLRAAEGKRRNMTISDAQVDAAFAALGSRVHLTPEQLKQALSQSGVEVSTLRQRIRGQLLWQQLVLQRFRQSVNISDQDIVQALQKQQSKDGNTPQDQQTNEYTIQMVIFVVPASAGKGGFESRMKEAEQLRAKFSGCANIAAEAHTFRETVVKNLGKRTQDELPANFLPLITDVPAGKMTKPITAPEGVEMLAVCDKHEVAGNLVERSKIEDNLRQQQGEVMARQYTQELRRFAVIEYK